MYGRKFGRRGGDAGFTLIEILVVIAVIGILSAIAAVTLQGAREKGIVATCDEMYTAFDGELANGMEQVTGGHVKTKKTPANWSLRQLRKHVKGKLNPRDRNRAAYGWSKSNSPCGEKGVRPKACKVVFLERSEDVIEVCQRLTRTGEYRSRTIAID